MATCFNDIPAILQENRIAFSPVCQSLRTESPAFVSNYKRLDPLEPDVNKHFISLIVDTAEDLPTQLGVPFLWLFSPLFRLFFQSRCHGRRRSGAAVIKSDVSVPNKRQVRPGKGVIRKC